MNSPEGIIPVSLLNYKKLDSFRSIVTQGNMHRQISPGGGRLSDTGGGHSLRDSTWPTPTAQQQKYDTHIRSFKGQPHTHREIPVKAHI